jgi:hypothetical protein
MVIGFSIRHSFGGEIEVVAPHLQSSKLRSLAFSGGAL